MIVLTLALGIGANTAIFTSVNALFLRSAPVADSDRLVAINSTSARDAQAGEMFQGFLPLSYPNFEDLRERAASLDTLYAYSPWLMSLGGDPEPERVTGMLVSASYFDALGVQPVLGRGFRPEEYVGEGAHPVLVLAHHLWQGRFGGDPSVTGRAVRLNGRDFTVVGVAPAGFRGTDLVYGVDLWAPMPMFPALSPLVHDAIAAEMIVQARACVPAERLHALHADATEGARLLERLQSDGLVVVRDDHACTSFPVLLNDAQGRYATITSHVAEDAGRELAADLAAVAELVQEQGWSDWHYHFVWSQLFDSQFAWTDMMQRGLVPPLGRLIAWVVYPGHPLRSGTNLYPDTELRDYWLTVTWRPGAANAVAVVGSAWEVIYRAALGGVALTASERAQLAELGLLDDTGLLHVPVLRHGDALHDLLQSAAGRYVAFLERRMPLEDLVALSRVDRQHTFAMAYHDISWGVLERLIRADGVRVPSALERGAHATQPSMRGVAALTPVHAPFADLIRAAIETPR